MKQFDDAFKTQVLDVPYPALGAADGRIYLCNKAARDFFGLDGVSWEEGLPLPQFISGPVLETFQSLLDEGCRVGRVCCEREGKPQIVDIKVQDGLVLLVFVPRLDPTDNAMPQFMLSLDMCMRSRLNTLLAALSGLKTGGDSEKNRVFAAEIRRNAMALLRLSNNLRATAVCIDNTDYADLELTDLPQLCRKCADEANAIAKPLEMTVSYSGPDQMVPVSLDRARIERILFNLISNALRFRRPGGRVDLILSHTETSLFLRVRDDGLGMDSETLANLFEKYRLFSINDTHLGLGLSISEAYAEQHGGAIFVESQKGKGTTVTVTLPRVTKDPGALGMPAPDYTGEYPHALIELSDIPAYNPMYE